MVILCNKHALGHSSSYMRLKIQKRDTSAFYNTPLSAHAPNHDILFLNYPKTQPGSRTWKRLMKQSASIQAEGSLTHADTLSGDPPSDANTNNIYNSL